MQRPCIWCQKGKKRKKKKDLALIMFCFFNLAASYMDLLNCVPGGSEVKESASNAGDLGSIPGSGRHPGEGNGNPPVFLPGEFHGQRSLVGYSPWGHRELDTTE